MLFLAGRWWGHSPGRIRTSRPGPAEWGTLEVHHHCVQKDRQISLWTRPWRRNWVWELDKECLHTWVFWDIWWWTNGQLGLENCSPTAPRREWLGGRATCSTSSPSEESEKVIGWLAGMLLALNVAAAAWSPVITINKSNLEKHWVSCFVLFVFSTSRQSVNVSKSENAQCLSSAAGITCKIKSVHFLPEARLHVYSTWWWGAAWTSFRDNGLGLQPEASTGAPSRPRRTLCSFCCPWFLLVSCAKTKEG